MNVPDRISSNENLAATAVERPSVKHARICELQVHLIVNALQRASNFEAVFEFNGHFHHQVIACQRLEERPKQLHQHEGAYSVRHCEIIF
jgi:hypothetical protein